MAGAVERMTAHFFGVCCGDRTAHIARDKAVVGAVDDQDRNTAMADRLDGITVAKGWRPNTRAPRFRNG